MPFAQQIQLPTRGQWVLTPWYSYSEFFHVWRGTQQESIETSPGEDGHGFDQNSGWLNVDVGVAKDWAADLAVGYTSAASRSFNAEGAVEKTSGLADLIFGLRYRICDEGGFDLSWFPAVTVRAGGIYRGGYDPEFPYAPGSGSVGIEPSVLLRRHFCWEGFGAYSHVGFRWMRSGGNDQWFATVGLQQEIKRFTLNLGYRHLGTTDGIDVGGSGHEFIYSRQVKEISEAIEGGVGFDDRGGRRYQLAIRKTLDGRNTGSALRFDVFVSFPLGGK